MLFRSILAEKREHLETQLEELHKAIAYIDEKQRFYADVTAGRTAYCSNVIDTTQSDWLRSVGDFCVP